VIAVGPADARYPARLLDLRQPPDPLWIDGDLGALRGRAVSIVGTRRMTPYGARVARELAAACASAGILVISGLAQGVDSAAHAGALEAGGKTIAVIGAGVNAYQAEIRGRRRNLAHAIRAKGALVSEFPLGAPPNAANFPRRNRLISGLARGCLVVEAALDSGSLITARLAAEQGREVLAIPGSIHSPLSKGCHALIKQGAKLVESAQDVLEELGGARAPDPTPSGSGASHDLLDKMGFDPLDIDELIARSGLTTEVVSAILLQWELEGKIASLPGGLYQRIG